MVNRLARLVATVPLILGTGCVSTPDGPRMDLFQLQQQVEATVQPLSDMAIILQDTDPELATTLSEVSTYLGELNDKLKLVIETGGGQVEALEAVDFFLSASESLLQVVTDDPEKQAKVRLSILAIRTILTQVKLSLK